MDLDLTKETPEPLSARKTSGLTDGKKKVFSWGKIKTYLM